ncbi:sugar ABC transporter permease YjfF, partial [Klebsiella pneumoniae]
MLLLGVVDRIVVDHLTLLGALVFAYPWYAILAHLLGISFRVPSYRTYMFSADLFTFAGIDFSIYAKAACGLAGVAVEPEASASVVIGSRLLSGGVGIV